MVMYETRQALQNLQYKPLLSSIFFWVYQVKLKVLCTLLPSGGNKKTCHVWVFKEAIENSVWIVSLLLSLVHRGTPCRLGEGREGGGGETLRNITKNLKYYELWNKTFIQINNIIFWCSEYNSKWMEITSHCEVNFWTVFAKLVSVGRAGIAQWLKAGRSVSKMIRGCCLFSSLFQVFVVEGGWGEGSSGFSPSTATNWISESRMWGPPVCHL